MALPRGLRTRNTNMNNGVSAATSHEHSSTDSSSSAAIVRPTINDSNGMPTPVAHPPPSSEATASMNTASMGPPPARKDRASTQDPYLSIVSMSMPDVVRNKNQQRSEIGVSSLSSDVQEMNGSHQDPTRMYSGTSSQVHVDSMEEEEGLPLGGEQQKKNNQQIVDAEESSEHQEEDQHHMNENDMMADDEQPPTSEDDEPDWESISQQEPARTDVPVFLSARDRMDAADLHFKAALDDIHTKLKKSVDDLMETAAAIYNDQRSKLDDMEMELKQDFVYNSETSAAMTRKLEESRSAFQGLVEQLLMRVSQPLTSTGTGGAANSSRRGQKAT